MALKFLNKKGWHTGSLRNIENVWKAEQKHEAEQRKLEELRKQIQEERERSEFRLLQEQAGFAPKQERLDFLYESGLAVGKGSSDGFKALEAPPPPPKNDAEPSSSKQASVPGALFEDKPQSANDSWRKLHSDPLLMIRQREQEALARIKNNPVQMAMIRKSVETKKPKEEKHRKKEHTKCHKKSKHRKHSSNKSDSEGATSEEDEERRKRSRQVGAHHKKLKHEKHSSKGRSDSEESMSEGEGDRRKRIYKADGHRSSASTHKSRDEHPRTGTPTFQHRPLHKRQQGAPRLTAEEKAARAREMQLDAELHEQQRWKRLKKASEADAQEASQSVASGSRSFLDAAHKSVYGTDKGGSATIEESVRRRTYYLQGKSEAHEGNAFRR